MESATGCVTAPDRLQANRKVQPCAGRERPWDSIQRFYWSCAGSGKLTGRARRSGRPNGVRRQYRRPLLTMPISPLLRQRTTVPGGYIPTSRIEIGGYYRIDCLPTFQNSSRNATLASAVGGFRGLQIRAQYLSAIAMILAPEAIWSLLSPADSRFRLPIHDAAAPCPATLDRRRPAGAVSRRSFRMVLDCRLNGESVVGKTVDLVPRFDHPRFMVIAAFDGVQLIVRHLH